MNESEIKDLIFSLQLNLSGKDRLFFVDRYPLEKSQELHEIRMLIIQVSSRRAWIKENLVNKPNLT